jgi:hypothetical protein
VRAARAWWRRAIFPALADVRTDYAWGGNVALIGRRVAGERIVHPLLDDALPSIPLYRGNPWFLPLVGAYYRFKDLVQ